MACKEMIRALDGDEFFRLRCDRDQARQILLGAKLVARSAYEQLALSAIAQEAIHVSTTLDRDRCPERNQPDDAMVGPSGAQSSGRAEGKPTENDRQMKLRVQPIERGTHVIDLTQSAALLAFAEPGPAKVAAQHRKA